MFETIIIDDDAIIRKGLKSIVDWEELGFSIEGEAQDGNDGIELARLIDPDLILTDIKMPAVDGLEMINEIRKFNAKVKIIIITAFRNFEYAKRALPLGVIDLLVKPTKIHDLTRTIETVRTSLTEQAQFNYEQKKFEQLFN